jgi:CO dehydrogenase/acetyl-CoA synthase epsilon subunit
MTSIKWLYKLSKERELDKFDWEQAKEMHKKEIIDAWIATDNELQRLAAEQYYQETFGQGITLQNNSESKGITELSDDSWEGCDGCTEQDEIMYKNGYVKGYNAAIAELPKEISDEEIENVAWEKYTGDSARLAWVEAIKWYREQLKQL